MLCRLSVAPGLACKGKSLWGVRLPHVPAKRILDAGTSDAPYGRRTPMSRKPSKPKKCKQRPGQRKWVREHPTSDAALLPSVRARAPEPPLLATLAPKLSDIEIIRRLPPPQGRQKRFRPYKRYRIKCEKWATAIVRRRIRNAQVFFTVAFDRGTGVAAAWSPLWVEDKPDLQLHQEVTPAQIQDEACRLAAEFAISLGNLGVKRIVMNGLLLAKQPLRRIPWQWAMVQYQTEAEVRAALYDNAEDVPDLRVLDELLKLQKLAEKRLADQIGAQSNKALAVP